MHRPGQEFGCVLMKTDQESDLLICKANTLKGGSQNGTAKNCNCKLSISLRHHVQIHCRMPLYASVQFPNLNVGGLFIKLHPSHRSSGICPSTT